MKMNTVIKLVKVVVTVAVGYGTKLIVDGAIDNNVSPDKFKQKLAINAASFVISGMATEATKKYTDARVDNFFEIWTKAREAKKEIENAEKEESTIIQTEPSVNSDI